MQTIKWKPFKLGNLFDRNTNHCIKSAKKVLDETIQPDELHTIQNITASKENNGCSGYLIDEDDISIRKKIGFLTVASDAAYGGICFYQDNYFVSTGHNNLLELKNNKLKNLLDENKYVYIFLSRIISKVLCVKGINRFERAIGNDFDRELILLPCYEIDNNSDYIWEENGKFYTLACDYIKKLLDIAKSEREKRTIEVYKADVTKYEIERKKFEDKYLTEKENVRWVGVKLEDLFIYSTGRDSTIAQKNLDISDTKTDEFNISIVTESKVNNGIGFYMKGNDPVLEGKVRINGLTFGTQFGSCNYHNYPYFIIGNTNYLIEKNDVLHETISNNEYVGRFFANTLQYVFGLSGLYGYNNKIDKIAFNREIILLPCLRVKDNEKCCFAIKSIPYVLAINYINYIYLTSRINDCNKLINNYKYEY